MHSKQEIINIIVPFLEEIGINTVFTTIDNNCFLPGISIFKNSILIDTEKLEYPGDILHEAGHIAVTPTEQRSLIGTSEIDANWPTDGEEIAAILWSYAATIKLNISPEIVFHENGYKNQSRWLIHEFENKNYIGLPLLDWMGLCVSTEVNIDNLTIPPFPHMIKWLR